jgi:hypothetical protein
VSKLLLSSFSIKKGHPKIAFFYSAWLSALILLSTVSSEQFQIIEFPKTWKLLKPFFIRNESER